MEKKRGMPVVVHCFIEELLRWCRYWVLDLGLKILLLCQCLALAVAVVGLWFQASIFSPPAISKKEIELEGERVKIEGNKF